MRERCQCSRGDPGVGDPFDRLANPVRVLRPTLPAPMRWARLWAICLTNSKATVSAGRLAWLACSWRGIPGDVLDALGDVTERRPESIEGPDREWVRNRPVEAVGGVGEASFVRPVADTDEQVNVGGQTFVGGRLGSREVDVELVCNSDGFGMDLGCWFGFRRSTPAFLSAVPTGQRRIATEPSCGCRRTRSCPTRPQVTRLAEGAVQRSDTYRRR